TRTILIIRDKAAALGAAAPAVGAPMAGNADSMFVVPVTALAGLAAACLSGLPVFTILLASTFMPFGRVWEKPWTIIIAWPTIKAATTKPAATVNTSRRRGLSGAFSWLSG